MSENQRPKDATKLSDASRSKIPSAPTPSIVKKTKEDLLKILGYNSSPLDLYLTVTFDHFNGPHVDDKDANNIEAEAKEEYVLESPELKRWLSRGSKSSSLFIDGGINKPCRVSFLTAAMSQTLSSSTLRSPDVIWVGYFCGIYANTDPTGCASKGDIADMMRSLIAQLISHLEISDHNGKKKKYLTYKFDEELLGRAEAGDLRGLCKFLGQIIELLPKGTIIYCVLDHITEYMGPITAYDAVKVIQKLIQLGKIHQDKLIMRLLLTSPRGRSIIGDIDHEGFVMVDKILEVPQDIK